MPPTLLLTAGFYLGCAQISRRAGVDLTPFSVEREHGTIPFDMRSTHHQRPERAVYR
jgi:hypothetical protein